ncbi:unnamed protein product, partial [Angiostrongylus costaricensis]|uniref:CLP1_P domain-containing protein n=1 Tax=Angiostrongylus costaricensis TaxID=334426 RepID=A0A0R3PSG7_ANGCS
PFSGVHFCKYDYEHVRGINEISTYCSGCVSHPLTEAPTLFHDKARTREGVRCTIVPVGRTRSGKSTLVRHLVNTNFEKEGPPIYILDADVGQSEFTPAGCMSLWKVSDGILGQLMVCNVLLLWLTSYFLRRPISLQSCQLRDLTIISYFSSVLPRPVLSSICDATPYSVNFKIYSFCVFLFTNELLCIFLSNNSRETRRILSDDSLPLVSIIRGGSPILKCHGFGIIRAVDLEKKIFYVITPVPLSELPRITIFARGTGILVPQLFFRTFLLLLLLRNCVFLDCYFPEINRTSYTYRLRTWIL